MYSPAPARENENGKTKLLEGSSNGSTYMDAGTTPAAGISDKTLEPLEVVNRAKKHSRQGGSRT